MLTVMIVDDVDFDRLDIRRLKLWGEKSGFYITAEAKNGSEALEKLQRNSVDLVITDIKMPKVDGIELLKKIMERSICQCVVLLSDYSDFNFVRQGLVLGAFDYLKKPVNENEIENLLIRAKDFILEKRREIERVKKLEEKEEIYFSRADIRQIIEYILNGDLRAIDAAEHIVKVIGANLSNNLIKVETVIKGVLSEIIKEVFKKYDWLCKFLCPYELENADFSGCDELDDFISVFQRNIKKITLKINLLYCGKSSNEIVTQVCNIVLENIDDEISLGILADKLFMNKNYISELFKQKTTIGFIEYLRIVKMERARTLINEGSMKIYEIGEKLGYKDIEYFSRQFKKYTGFSPIEYRQNSIYKDN